MMSLRHYTEATSDDAGVFDFGERVPGGVGMVQQSQPKIERKHHPVVKL